MSLVHVTPCQFCTLIVESPISMPLFFVEPMFCSVDVKPDVTGSRRVSSRSCVFCV